MPPRTSARRRSHAPGAASPPASTPITSAPGCGAPRTTSRSTSSAAAPAGALERLAQLDSAVVPAGALLVACVDGTIAAALAIGSGVAIADPFRPTTAYVELLARRAAQLRGDSTRKAAHARVSRAPSRARATVAPADARGVTCAR